jgi:hypothetical protein
MFPFQVGGSRAKIRCDPNVIFLSLSCFYCKTQKDLMKMDQEKNIVELLLPIRL